MKTHISYFLDEHGWSTCWFYHENQQYVCNITHVFSPDPIGECIDVLQGILTGRESAEFTWYDEPGGTRIAIKEIPTKKHMVSLTIDEFSEDFSESTRNYKEVLSFEIKKVQLIRMFYFEFKKIGELMRDKHYQLKRNGDFPFTTFRKFETLAIQYIDLM